MKLQRMKQRHIPSPWRAGWLPGWLAIALMMGGMGSGYGTAAHAQPDDNEQGKAQNPMPQNPLPQMPFANPQAWQKMTPEERRGAARQAVEQTLRGSMGWLGFADQALQDAVVTAALERETALDVVREKHRAVTQGLLNKAVTDEQMLVLAEELQAAMEEAATRREASLAALEEKIHFSQKPRLAAFLSLTGVTGDESAYLGGILGNVMGAMANMAAARPAAEPNPQPAAQPDPQPDAGPNAGQPAAGQAAEPAG
jgi:hypothetical protein